MKKDQLDALIATERTKLVKKFGPLYNDFGDEVQRSVSAEMLRDAILAAPPQQAKFGTSEWGDKGAYGMVLLREQILGPERFDWAFRKYIKDWAFKHPSPSDFFRAMESEGGEDLSWFWRGWYLNNWRYDVAVDKIDGGTVTLSNKGKLVLPTPVEIVLKSGEKIRVKIPVEAWLSKSTWSWSAPAGKAVASVVVDPDHVLPDDDRGNNSKTAE